MKKTSIWIVVVSSIAIPTSLLKKDIETLSKDPGEYIKTGKKLRYTSNWDTSKFLKLAIQERSEVLWPLITQELIWGWVKENELFKPMIENWEESFPRHIKQLKETTDEKEIFQKNGGSWEIFLSRFLKQQAYGFWKQQILKFDNNDFSMKKNMESEENRKWWETDNNIFINRFFKLEQSDVKEKTNWSKIGFYPKTLPFQENKQKANEKWTEIEIHKFKFLNWAWQQYFYDQAPVMADMLFWKYGDPATTTKDYKETNFTTKPTVSSYKFPSFNETTKSKFTQFISHITQDQNPQPSDDEYQDISTEYTDDSSTSILVEAKNMHSSLFPAFAVGVNYQYDKWLNASEEWNGITKDKLKNKKVCDLFLEDTAPTENSKKRGIKVDDKASEYCDKNINEHYVFDQINFEKWTFARSKEGVHALRLRLPTTITSDSVEKRKTDSFNFFSYQTLSSVQNTNNKNAALNQFKVYLEKQFDTLFNKYHTEYEGLVVYDEPTKKLFNDWYTMFKHNSFRTTVFDMRKKVLSYYGEMDIKNTTEENGLGSVFPYEMNETTDTTLPTKLFKFENFFFKFFSNEDFDNKDVDAPNDWGFKSKDTNLFVVQNIADKKKFKQSIEEYVNHTNQPALEKKGEDRVILSTPLLDQFVDHLKNDSFKELVEYLFLIENRIKPPLVGCEWKSGCNPKYDEIKKHYFASIAKKNKTGYDMFPIDKDETDLQTEIGKSITKLLLNTNLKEHYLVLNTIEFLTKNNFKHLINFLKTELDKGFNFLAWGPGEKEDDLKFTTSSSPIGNLLPFSFQKIPTTTPTTDIQQKDVLESFEIETTFKKTGSDQKVKKFIGLKDFVAKNLYQWGDKQRVLQHITTFSSTDDIQRFLTKLQNLNTKPENAVDSLIKELENLSFKDKKKKLNTFITNLDTQEESSEEGKIKVETQTTVAFTRLNKFIDKFYLLQISESDLTHEAFKIFLTKHINEDTFWQWMFDIAQQSSVQQFMKNSLSKINIIDKSWITILKKEWFAIV